MTQAQHEATTAAGPVYQTPQSPVTTCTPHCASQPYDACLPRCPGRTGSTRKHDIPHDRHLGMHNMPHHGHAGLHQHAQLVLPILLFSLLAPLASRPIPQGRVQHVDGHLIAGDFPVQAQAPTQHQGQQCYRGKQEGGGGAPCTGTGSRSLKQCCEACVQQGEPTTNAGEPNTQWKRTAAHFCAVVQAV